MLRDVGYAKGKFRTLNFRKAKFQLLMESVYRIPWKIALRDKGAERSWQIFKDTFCRAQELWIPSCEKSGKEGKTIACLTLDLLDKLKGKKEMPRQWEPLQVSWEEYSDAGQLCMDGVRKVKVQMEMNVARDAKCKKQYIYRYVSQKRKAKECVPPQ